MGDPLEEVYRWLACPRTLARYRDIVEDVVRVETASGVLAKIRVLFSDGSFLDIYWSPRGRYSLYYERRHVDGTVYRHDNAPHKRHRSIPTFPRHFHYQREDNVVESRIPEDPVDAVREFLEFIRTIIRRQKP